MYVNLTQLNEIAVQPQSNSHLHYTPTVTDDVTTYTTLIADVQEVHDDSSDFELPETVVA